MVKGYFRFDSWLGAVVEDVRTIFQERNDATVYIPTFTSLITYQKLP